MEEQKHILDVLIEKIKYNLEGMLSHNVEVYLAMDENDNELLAIKDGDKEQGLDLSQIVKSYAVFRVFQTNSEEEALEKLAENLSISIKSLLESKKES